MIATALRIDLLGYVVQLARMDRLYFVVAVLFCGMIAAYGVLARRRALRSLAGTERLARKLGGGVSLARIVVKSAAICVGLLAVSLALLRPQVGERAALAKRKGIDLVVAVDASRSMWARDVLPSRLDRAKLELAALIDKLQGDRVGLVAFAGEAFVQCPLTGDYGAAKLFLRAIDPGAMPSQGTALAAALETAGTMLSAADRGAKVKVVLLLTDGEDHVGDVMMSARKLESQGVKVFVLGIGSHQGTPVPILDDAGKIAGYVKDRSGQTVITRLEDRALRAIADVTGGRYIAASGSDLGMGEIAAELDRLEKSELESLSTVEYAEAFPYVLYPGFLFLVVGALLPERRRMK